MTRAGFVATALLAVALFALAPLCGALDAHAAASGDHADSCCASVEGATNLKPVDFAAGGGFPPALAGFTRAFTAAPLHAAPLLRAASGFGPRSFYARSARILR